VKVLSVVFGFLAALVVGALAALFTGSLTLGTIVFVVIIGIGIAGAVAAEGGLLTAIGVGMLALFLVSSAFTGWQVVQLVSAFGGTDGPADPADPAALASAQDKVKGIGQDAGFRLEMTEDEIQAVVQDALSDGESPLARVLVDVIGATADDAGEIKFTGEFKEGNLSVDGVVSARIVAGAAEIEVVSIDAGMFTLPGVAKGAIQDLIEEVSDLNTILAEQRAQVQSIIITDDSVTVTGTLADGAVLTSQTLLQGLAANAREIANAVEPPSELFGPGEINSTSADGPTYYVALGDSLAANVGVEQPRDGYVSRLHNQLEIRDGVDYGLRNFGVSGETTATMIRTGQLDQAVDFMESVEVDYVTIDIGANDLLGHLASDDCIDGLSNPACQTRMESAFAQYEANMIEIFDAIEDAAPDATIIFMRAYNPFSLGFGASVGFEEESSATLDAFNDIAAEIAEGRGILVADAFTPMEGTTAATTHMLDDPPDIHPYPIGYDILTGSFIAALG
jgi:lysophospholipase L1-like esterase